MRVGQLWSWIYARGVTSFADMSNVSKQLRTKLAQTHTLLRPEIVTEQISVDGTRKWLLRLPRRGHDARAPEIECVYIPEQTRGTLCISSQIGCTRTCSLCHTGTQKLVRNLEPEEIVGQIMLARDRMATGRAQAHRRMAGWCPLANRKITNLVLRAWANRCTISTTAAVALAADGDGLALPEAHHAPTSGVVPDSALGVGGRHRRHLAACGER
jgi:23S rRNA (adenine2503-C2)-methyltransferase